MITCCDLQKKSVGDDHFLRFAKRSGMDDHMLRFAKSGMDDHMLRFAKKSNMEDHFLRFAKKDDPEMAVELPEVEESNDEDSKMDLAKRWYYTRGSRGQMNDHMLRFA